MATISRQTISILSSVGIDIGEDVFHLVGFDPNGQVVLRRKIRRLDLVKQFSDLPRCIVGMEACLSAHFVSRTLRGLGFRPRIIPAKYTRPFIKGQKNDYNDPEAFAEAALRPNSKVVREKARDRPDHLDGHGRAAIGTGEAFDRGRDFGAWLGLVPRQCSTGGKPILGKISKRGNRYLRTLFLQAAPIILMRPKNRSRFSFGPWLEQASQRMHKNKLAAALANKRARIAWASCTRATSSTRTASRRPRSIAKPRPLR